MLNKYINFIYILLMFIATSAQTNTVNNIYQYNFEDIDGNSLNLNNFKGKPILLVNTASKCGFTPQYGDLQNLFKKYKNTDLVFIATPSNDFKQELATEDEIKKFCLINYGVSFNVTEIIRIKGNQAHPVFRWIKNEYKQEPKWNFYKYLFNRDGQLVKSWSSITNPSSSKIQNSINKVL